MKRISFLSNKYKNKTEHRFYNKIRDKQAHSQIKMCLKNITKIEKYKKTWSTKYQRINKQTDKDKKTESDTLAD